MGLGSLTLKLWGQPLSAMFYYSFSMVLGFREFGGNPFFVRGQ